MKAEIIVAPDKLREEIMRLNAATRTTAPEQKTFQASVSPVVPDYSVYVKQAAFAQVLSLVTPVRMSVVQYYVSRGDWPVKLEDIGFSAEEMRDGKYIDSVSIKKTGSILVSLSQYFGSNKKIKLSHESIMGGTNLKTQCTTNVAKKILVSIPACESDLSI